MKCKCKDCKLQKRILQILKRQNIFHNENISEDTKNQIIETFAMLEIILMTDKDFAKFNPLTNKEIQRIEDSIELRFGKKIKRKTPRRFQMY